MNHNNNNNNNNADKTMDDDEENNVDYWKAKYEDLNNQYDEYQKHSYELENELETQLKQSEEKIRDLENKNRRLCIDNDTLKNKLNEINTTTHKQISQLQEELAKSKAVKDEMQKYIRELEQKNDDLERTNRCAMFSLADFESKINEALERNAILESELDEKDQLAETVQRLRDEARDLRQELAVRQKKETHPSTSSTTSILTTTSIHTTTPFMDCNEIPDGMMMMQHDQLHSFDNQTLSLDVDSSSSKNTSADMDSSSCTTSTTIAMNNGVGGVSGSGGGGGEDGSSRHDVMMSNHQQHAIPQQGGSSCNNLKASTRITALNYVGDILRKITSLESRLMASRNLVKETNKDRRSIANLQQQQLQQQQSINGDQNNKPNARKIMKKETSIPNTP